MIEKLQDKEKRVETTTECGKDDGLSRKLCIREAESRTSQKVHELEKESISLQQKLQRMEKERERLQPEEKDKIYLEYLGVFTSSVCS